MKKERKGLTLIALVVTIIVLLIVVAIVITLTSGENGLFNKANTTNYNNAVAELYDRSYAEISYLVIPKALLMSRSVSVTLNPKSPRASITISLRIWVLLRCMGRDLKNGNPAKTS